MRRKILLGLLPLLVLLVAMGGYAVVLFARLGGAVEVILRENYRSVAAAQTMKEAAERMESALLFHLADDPVRARQIYAESLPRFAAHLKIARGNITLPAERPLVERLGALQADCEALTETFFATADPAARRQLYLAEVGPLLARIKATAQAVLDLNEAHMLRADRDARQMAANSTRHMIVAVLFGLVVATFLAVRLQRALLRPIADLTAGARELGDGNYDQVVPVPSHDELGQLADTFNKLAGKLRAYRQTSDGRILRARQTTAATFSAFPDPIFVLSPEGSLEFSNPSGARLLAKLDDGLLPGPVLDGAAAVAKGGPDVLPENFEKAICVRVDELETFLLPRIVGIRNDAGAVFGVAVILQDVTRFRLLDEVKSNLVSTVSHELKTPLTSIRMGLHLLLEEQIGTLNPAQVELTLAAREDAERLLRMINDLLDLARLESGAAGLSLEPVSAESLLAAARAAAAGPCEQHGLRLVCEPAPGLPDVLAEPQKLAHVFSNFISNAVKHAPLGSEITLAARQSESGMVRFSVTDRGPGIPPSAQARIFERFVRLPSDGKSGAGLGLAISREIVTAHGGHIGVESEPGLGSEFYFELPPANSPET